MRRLPLHPLLFAAFPLLYLFVQNAERVRFGKVVGPLVVVLVTTIVVTLIASLVLRNVRRGAIVASGFALLALSYGHLWNAIRDKAIFGLVVGRDMFLLPFWALIGLLVVLFARRVKALDETTGIINAVALGLFLLAVWNTSSALAAQSDAPFQANVGKNSQAVPVAKGDGTKRDIFYLIFDRYGSGQVLEKYLGFDNEPFLNDLRKRGFFVADESQSNYPTTAHSVASSLNMDYLDQLAKQEGRKSKDWKPLYRSIPNSKVPRFLLEQGYRYAHVGPWYDPTASDPSAHVNYHYDKRSEFSRVLIETTIIQPLSKRVGFLKDFDSRQITHNQIKFQFDSILDADQLPGPTYTFAHLLLPHEPFTFDENGRYLSEDDALKVSWEHGYAGQVKYANKRILSMFDRLLDRPPDKRPIIVLQADEGPKRYGWTYGGERRWKDATDDELELKFGILNAYFLPDDDAKSFNDEMYDDITPVNSFRRIFDIYFGTDLGTLPDENFVYGNGEEPYRFTDVTKRIDP